MNKPCALCKKLLAPHEQFGHRETLCWQHWQEFESYILDVRSMESVDKPTREQMLLNFKELYAD